MRPVIAGILGAMVCASQASALSCMRPDPARTYQQIAAVEERYVVLLGVFDFDQPERLTILTNTPEEITVPARFEGAFLSAAGFVDAPAFDLTIDFTCSGPWCGSLANNGEETLAFVQETPDGYVLTVDACQSVVFGNPRDGAMQKVESCMRGEGCEPDALR